MGIARPSYFVEIYNLSECLGIYDENEEQIIYENNKGARQACLEKMIEIAQKENKNE